MDIVDELQSSTGKKIEERDKSVVLDLFKQDKLKTAKELSEVIIHNKDNDVYLLVMPRMLQILFNDALQKCTDILHRYENKGTKEKAEKLKSELHKQATEDPNYLAKLLALSIALKYFSNVDEFKSDDVAKLMDSSLLTSVNNY